MIQAIGKLTVPVPGTPVRATSGQSNPAANLICHGFLFQALPTNTGKVYIGVAGMDKAALSDVLAILPVPTSNLLPTFSAAVTIAPNALRLEQLYLDADNPDEGAICTILVT